MDRHLHQKIEQKGKCMKKNVRNMNLTRRVSAFLLCAAAVALLQIVTVPSAFADAILGSNLSTFAILGGAGVAINGTGSVITGSIGGCCNATAVTGVIPTNFNISGGTVQMGGAVAAAAQGELTSAMTTLGNLNVTNATSVVGGGQTLAPGVYSSASQMNLTGSLTLDGGSNANALWVFEVGSSLFANNATVTLTNVGSGAGVGVFWVMKAGSATLNNTTFVGNVLANQSISLTGASDTDSCGRLLTQVASVTLAGTDTIGIGCSGILLGSNGLSGGGTITTLPSGAMVVTPLPFAPVPEPGTVVLVGAGIACLVARRLRAPASKRL